ncbi:S9 family peptidase [Alistipes sp. AF17-16]|uniref:S9 family peptidase n=3 Tax=Rikenellaceae TaxID=171550 RepID=A0ABR7CK94_9BACT|nr:S9 family peptidase [Alistipes hominis]MBS1414995.1 S9 family peptidase [Alistipes sp.]RHR67492.1 S9 family peptidase [Alistipes sp. AF17-16]
MKRGLFFVLKAVCCVWMVLPYGCSFRKNDDKMSADHVLTDAERSAGILTPEVMWKIKRVGSAVLSPDGRTVLYTVTTYDMKENKGVTNIRSAPVSGGKWIRVTDPGSNESSPQWSADGRTIYFISDHGGSDQVWCAAPDGNNRRQVTDISGGVEGFSVAPSENRLMYVARVPVEKRSSPEIYPDLDRSKAKIYDDLMERHWNYWDDGSYRHIFIAPLTGGAKVTGGTDIMPGEPWDAPTAPYFDISEIAWNRAGTQLAYTCKKLTGKAYALSTDSDVYLYDLASGQTRNLTEGMPGYDKYPVFSPDDSMLAFTSMERAGNESDKSRLFVETLATGEKRYLTRNFDYNAGNVRWDGNGTLYFIAPVRGTYQVCRVDLADDSVRVLTAGAHDVNAITLNGGELVGEVTSLSAPTELFRIDPADGTMTRITNTNPEIYDHIRMGEVRERWIRTTDGRQMLTWVVLPPDFDSTERYPALLYCQGGPQSVVSQFWSYRWNLQLMAAQGYVVVAPNRRGVPSFGQQWLDQISGDYSGQNIRDYLSAIDDVAAEPWVDGGRLGCVGASYGGYSVFFLAGHHQKRFKAFIAHCGMFNLESMYGATEELWFPNNDLGGPYWSDDTTAQRSYANSPHKFVKNWDTPILIFSGQGDFRIPYTESLQAFTAARLMGVPSRLVSFEDEAHQIFKPQNSLVWNREFFGWLDKYLKHTETDSAQSPDSSKR